MAGMDSLTRTAILAGIIAAIHQTGASGSATGGGGGPVIPDVALQFDPVSGRYQIVQGNTDPPDAYFVDNAGVVELQAGATSGLTMTPIAGSDSYERVELSTP